MIFVWPIGVPALFACILVSLRNQLRNTATDEHGELERNNNRRIDRYAFFFDVYKPNCWWWEIYESLRRVACTGVLQRCATRRCTDAAGPQTPAEIAESR